MFPMPRSCSTFSQPISVTVMLLCFLVHHVVAGEFFGFAGCGVNFLALFQLGDNAIDPGILVGGLFAGAGNNQRGAGFVDQDGIHFIDDGEVVLALHAIANIKLHVVAQIIETKLVVGAVGDIRGVGFAALFVVQIVHDDAHGQAQEAIELAHPLGIAFGQVVVDRDHVHAAAAERVQIHRQGRDQGLPFAGLHFGDLALVQHHAADQLHVEVAHVEHPAPGFADHGEGFHQKLVKDLVDQLGAIIFELLEAIGIGVRLVGQTGQAFLNALAEFVRLGAQLVVRELLHLRLKRTDGLDPRHQALQFALVLGPENLT